MTAMIGVPPPPVRLKEKISRGILRAVKSNFRNLPEAILELVDNAVDEFDGVHGGTQLSVAITIGKERITIENVGGKGMSPKELQRWLEWGESDKTDSIGEFGQGGKAAMGYLGNAWVIRCKRYDDEWVWETRDDNWNDISVAEKELQAKPLRHASEYSGIGYCYFEIRKLTRRRQELAKLKAQLSNVYRRLLADGKLVITVDGDQVKPLDLPLYDGFESENFREKTSLGWAVRGWIGRLKRDSRIRGAVSIRGGLRLTRKGRLITDGEYFGHPDFRYRASLNTLIGEVEMPRVLVLPNKTDFDRGSPEWEAAEVVMHRLLKPHVDALLAQRDEEKVTKEDKRTIREARDLMIKALDWLSKQGLSSPFAPEGAGRKPPSRNGHQRGAPSKTRVSPTRERIPRTEPPDRAVGRLRRLGMMPEWKPDVLDPSIRSTWQDGDGRKVLAINKRFPLWEERRGDLLYVGETASLELAKLDTDEEMTVTEYFDEVNRMLSAFCQAYRGEG